MKTRLSIVAVFALVAGLFVGGSAAAAVPANDNFASATSLGNGTTATIAGSNVGATGEAGEPNHANVSLKSGCTDATHPNSGCEPSVWYTWTAPDANAYTIQLCGSDYDTTLGVYTGTAVGALTAVGSDDNGTGCSSNLPSRVTLTTTTGTTYNIAVAGFHGASGTISGMIQPCTDAAAHCPAPDATTTAATGLSGTGATLNGTVNPNGQSTDYLFRYGTSPTALSSDTAPATSAGNGSAPAAATAMVTGLAPSTTYYFQVEATNGAGTSDGAIKSFTTNAQPTVTTGSATGVTGTSATLNGTVNPAGSPTTYHFEYGTTTGYGTNTATISAGSGTTTQSVSAPISGLTTGQTYHFRLVAVNTGGSSNGDDASFKTFAAPVATTGTASPVTPVGATLNATVNPSGQPTSYHFEWGTNTNYGNLTPSASAGSDSHDHSVSANITGLTPSTPYHFRIVASNATGMTQGGDGTFTTLAANQPPHITYPTPNVTSVSGTAVTLNAFVDPEGVATNTIQFDWTPDPLVGTVYQHTNVAAVPSSLSGDSANHTVTASLTGLTAGTTYHFRAHAVNANGTGTGADQTFVAEAPPTATTDAATNVIDVQATLNGRVSAPATTTTGVTGHFEWGTDTTYGSTTGDVGVTADGNNHSVSADLSNLTPGTTYHYRLVATNGESTVNGADATFTTKKKPDVVTDPATSVTPTSATLNGTVNPNGLATSYQFEYDTVNPPVAHTGTTSAGSGTTVQPASTAVTGLAPGTTYFFRISATSAANGGTPSNGSILSFTTPASAAASTGPATSIDSTAATLNGTVTPGGQDTSYRFEYGLSNIYDHTTPVVDAGNGSATQSVSAAITGLTASTLYHFHVVATNPSGTFDGGDNTFTTAANGTPLAFTKPATLVTPASATLNATVNPQGSSTQAQFLWGPTTSYGFSTPLTNVGSDSTNHALSAALTRLTAGQTYHYQVVATNTAGSVAGDDLTFTAAAAPTATTKPASNVDAFTATLNGAINPQGSETTFHFEWATSTAYGNNTPEDTLPADTATHNVSATLAGLEQGQVYHFRVVATNAGGTSNGADMTFIACGSCHDFNGDGNPDLLYWNNHTGHISVWFMGGTDNVVKQGGHEISPDGTSNLAWKPFAAGDVNRDGHPDIAYWNKRTGHISIWFMGGTNGVVKQGSQEIVPDGTSNTSWVPSALGDFNGDGRLDIMYWNKNTGHISIWFMGGANGVVRQGGQEITPDGTSNTTWIPFATSDVDTSGTTDIAFWNNHTGHISMWFMGGTNGTVKQGGSEITPDGTSNTAWTPFAAGDIDGDGQPDISYWNKRTGHISEWFMGGTDGVIKQDSSELTPDGTSNTTWIPFD